MKLKKIKEFLFNNEIDMHERLFVLIMSVTIVSWLVTLVEIVLIGGTLRDILFLLAGIVLLTAVVVLSVRLDRITVGAMIITAGIVLVYQPMTFFFGGGIYGDAPLWFLFGVVLINISMKGKAKVLFMIMDTLVSATCWGLSCYMPELVVPNSPLMAHSFSFAALVLISICVTVMVTLQNMMYDREVKISLKQKKEIENLNISQSRFFSSMSHEIRTPINTIIGLNEMILRENISEEVAEDAANIGSAGKMLLHLINDILDMSKLESGQMQLTNGVYHPGDMLSEIVGMLWIRAKQKNLDFRVNVAPDIPYELIGDEVRIKQILINVLNNAIKYTKEGSVSLSMQCGERDGNTLSIIYTVTDTGIGIKKEDIPYLFTAFKRADEDHNRHIEGTGLGLSIVKQLAELMGGTVTVNSVYMKGSTFIVEIPQVVMGDQSIGELNLERRHDLSRRVNYNRRFEAPDAKVLVVDDNESNLLVIRKLLRDTKVQVETVSSGAEALKKTLANEYHVIFMDHLMPDMDGIECHRNIRTQVGGRCRDAKIVALTANAGSDSRTLYAREGFDGYLTKPVNGNELENELCRLLPSDIVFLYGEDNEILEETISWMRSDQRKKNIIVTTESVADLPQELIDEYGISVLPHSVCTEDGVFLDGCEIETMGLLNYMRDNSRSVMTKSPDVRTHEEFFAENLAKANNIIHISISSKVANSGCHAAKEAAAAFDNVTVIDTGHLSSGQGLLVIEACRLAEAGKTPAEIAERIEQLRSKVKTSFVVDNLDYLARAHQVSKRIADIMKSFMAKPVLVMRNGRLSVGGIYFGARERVWKQYIDNVLRAKSDIDDDILFVTYVGLTKRELDEIRNYAAKKMNFRHIYFHKASPAVAVNCGEGTFGLLLKHK